MDYKLYDCGGKKAVYFSYKATGVHLFSTTSGDVSDNDCCKKMWVLPKFFFMQIRSNLLHRPSTDMKTVESV